LYARRTGINALDEERRDIATLLYPPFIGMLQSLFTTATATATLPVSKAWRMGDTEE